jgi:hypothetical protein
MSVVQVNAATFDAEVKNASGPVVVKFFGKG